MTWQKFEIDARNALSKKLGVELYESTVSINGACKSFDIFNKNQRIVGDVKNYKMTKGGHQPSAKFSTLNEYVWLMQTLEKYTQEKWKKILVVGDDREALSKYLDRNSRWLDDVEVYYFSSNEGVERVR